MCAMHMCFGEVRKEKTHSAAVWDSRLSRDRLSNRRSQYEKNPQRGNRPGNRPLFFDRSATIIGRLGHHVETRNRKPAGTSMAFCLCFAYLFCPTTRNVSAILFFFFFHGTFVLHRYALSYPRVREFHEQLNSSSFLHLPPPSSGSAISRGIYGGFVAPVYRPARNVLLPRGFQMLFRIRLGKLREARGSLAMKNGVRASRSCKKRIQYLLKVRTTERARRCWC